MGTCKTLLVGYGITSQYQLLVNLMRFKKYKKTLFLERQKTMQLIYLLCKY